jgi:hypothetical protein
VRTDNGSYNLDIHFWFLKGWFTSITVFTDCVVAALRFGTKMGCNENYRATSGRLFLILTIEPWPWWIAFETVGDDTVETRPSSSPSCLNEINPCSKYISNADYRLAIPFKMTVGAQHYYVWISLEGAQNAWRGHTVAYLVEGLGYKLEGRWTESRWDGFFFFFPIYLLLPAALWHWSRLSL